MATKLIPLACNHCSAPLSVPEDVRFVTCGHCNTSLSVEHEGDAFFTRKLDQISAATEKIGSKVEELHAEMVRGRQGDARRRLDDEWAEQRKRYLVDTSAGPASVPQLMDTVHVWVGMTFIGVVVVAIVGAESTFHLGALAAAFAVCGVAAVAVIAKVGETNSKARLYQSAFEEYQRRRAAISEQNDSVGNLENTDDAPSPISRAD